MAQKKVVSRPGVAIVRESLVNLADDRKRHGGGKVRLNQNGFDQKFVSGVDTIRAFFAGENLNARPGWRKGRQDKSTETAPIYNEKEINADASDESPVKSDKLCSFFFSEVGCKYGEDCRFSHTLNYNYDDEGEGDEEGDMSPLEPVLVCPFLSVGCRFGSRCKYLHPIVYEDPELLLASAFTSPSQSPIPSPTTFASFAAPVHSPIPPQSQSPVPLAHSTTPAQSPQPSPAGCGWKSPRVDAPPFVPSAAAHASLAISPTVPVQTRPLAVVLRQKSITNATFSTTHTITTYSSTSTTKRSFVFSPEFVPSTSLTRSDSETSASLASSPSSPSSRFSSPCTMTRSLSLQDCIHSPVFSPSISAEGNTSMSSASSFVEQFQNAPSEGHIVAASRSRSEAEMTTPVKSSGKEVGQAVKSPENGRSSFVKAELRAFTLPMENGGFRKERKMSENVAPSNEPWVPRWKQAENTAFRERKLSATEPDGSLRQEQTPWEEAHGASKQCSESEDDRRKPLPKGRRLSLEGLPAAGAHAQPYFQEDGTCFRV